ncbi:hypothetical protein B5M09_011436 [Aphanomyces astaci]|uniref:FYVE-type domain-containing protein n=1 Tax=Aphanomyces astaci TaxID=112090 RepID=A0A425D1W8_APHAT|nr:hypothetical protein B5M09_011436 [Aphanomyces astaci]
MAAPSTFPLPDGYFSCPVLSPDAVRQYVSMGETMCLQLVQRAKLHGGAIQWSMLADTKDVQMYSGHDPDGPPASSTFCGVTVVPSSIDEIAAAFQCSNTQQYREYCRRFSSGWLDAVNLYSVQPRTVAQPYCSTNIKWHVQQSPAPSLIKHRDHVFVESCHEFHVSGTSLRGWVQALKSIELPICPEFPASFNVVRGIQHLSGYVFLESPDQPGHVRVASMWQLNPRGKVPKWVITNAIKQRCVALQTDLNSSFQKARLLQSMPALLPQHAMIPTSHRLRCFACQKRFRPFSRKQNCRVCGEVVCRRCSQTWQTNELDVCLCVVCSMEMVKRPVLPLPGPCQVDGDGVALMDRSGGGAADALSTMSSSQSDEVIVPHMWRQVEAPPKDGMTVITVEDFLNMISILEDDDAVRRTSIDAMSMDDGEGSYVAESCRNDLIRLPRGWGDYND